MADQEEDYSSLPLTDRAAHKIWKVRLAAYEEMTKQFSVSGSESDPCFRPFLSDPALFKKIVTDSNVAAQEAGINALTAFIRYGGTNACQKLRGTIVTPLAEKGLASMRAGTKQKTVEALLYFIEMDTPDPVVEELIPILGNKLPKLVAGVVMALREIFKAFGTKTVQPKAVLKSLPKLFAHSDKNVRAETTSLTVELYKWMGDTLKMIALQDLKPVQQKELEELFESVKDIKPQQERFLLSQQRAILNSSSPDVANDEAGEEEEADPYDIIETVDITNKIPGDFFDRVTSVKWKDRKEAMDDLIKVLSVPKIADSDFLELTRSLGKCVAKDANVAVVTVAANCIEALAKGLRSGFAKYKQNVFSSLLERLKEKKQSVSEALASALDAVFESTTLADVLEDVLEFTKHKNPQVKQETTMFLVRCLRVVKVIPKNTDIKAICDACISLLADTAKPVRSAAAEAMGTVMKMIGERAMTPYIDGLDDIRKGMIKEFYETATVKAKPEKVVPPAASMKSAPTKSGAPGVRTRPPISGLKKPSMATSSTSNRSSIPSETSTSTASSTSSRLSHSTSRTSRIGTVPSSTLRKRADEHASSPRTSASSSNGTPPRAVASRGLTGVSLPSSSTSSTHSGLTAAEKSELADLRRAKEEWEISTAAFKKQLESLQSENSKLSQAISELQLSNKQLIEDHTRDILAVKAKESQLARLRSEVETSKAQTTRLQRELDNTKSALAVIEHEKISVDSKVTTESDLKDMHSNTTIPSPRRKSGGFSFEAEKENDYGISPISANSRPASLYTGTTSHSRTNSFSPVSVSSNEPIANDITSSTANAGSVESWRRAAEVTSQLKARIEAMKARQMRKIESS
ncbi:armadillo-type protein [Dipodascopsis uninucleata]